MTIVNLKALKIKLKDLPKISNKSMVGVIVKWGEKIMTEAKKLTPIEFGTLRNSGHVSSPKSLGKTSTITLGFGGPAKKYAVIVHETLFINHKVGQAKFLSVPFNDARPKVEKDIISSLRARYREIK